MPGPSNPANDDSRISGVAAITALGGHAAVILALLLLAGRAPEVVITPNVVGVTLVSGQPGGSSKSASEPPTRAAPAPADSALAETPREDSDASGDRLDSLTATSVEAPVASVGGGASRPAATSASGASGSSRADQGLGQGEAAEGVDLYAAASLPSVGTRPAPPPSGDLWQRVAPCWRSAAPREATLRIEIRGDGGLAATPQAIRRGGTPADAQTSLAERAAVRAVQACAPYAGLGGGPWRVVFPERRL
jgi:hypothetical protein